MIEDSSGERTKMTHDCPATQGSGSRRLVTSALKALIVVSLLLAPAAGVSARTLSPLPAARAWLSTGTTLAVVRAGGASLLDDAGQIVVDLPMGAAVKVSGRTADNRWFYGATRDGATGWVSADSVLIFGVENVPERGGFAGPAATASQEESAAATTTPAGAAQSAAAAAPRREATVASGAQRLNVRSGPGTAYPVVSSVASGASLTASGRTAGADWIQVEGPALPGRAGWVSARYLDLEGSAQDLPVAAAAAPAPMPATPPATAPRLAGKLVFQESSGGAIDVYDLATGALRPLTTGADPAISPDGRTVAFWRDTGEQGLYLVDVDGGNERRILTRGELVRAPAWSPDGQEIVFSHVTGEHRCRYAGYNVCLPDEFPYNFLFELVTTDRWALASVDRTGGSYRDLAALPSAYTPSWTDRGIFYSSAGVYSGGGIQVTQAVAGEDQNRMVAGEYRYQDPAGQPGGDRVVFHSLEKDHWEIFTATIDGSGLTALTHPDPLASPLPHNVSPAWSPDGLCIVFLSNRTGAWKLWAMNADGSDQRPLPIDAPIAYNYQAEQVVSWGP
jgi:Tol biopolymer transport system component/uncharacterized protein YraI